MAVNHDGTRVYVTDSDADKVHVIDTATNEIIDSIDVGASPDGVAVVRVPDASEAGFTEWVYVANFLDDTVTAINTSTGAKTTIALDPSSASVAGRSRSPRVRTARRST